MSMPPADHSRLTCDPGGSKICALHGVNASVAFADLRLSTILETSTELAGRSVLVATSEQLTAAAVLLELDGVARRLVLYPPDLASSHLAYVARCAQADVIVTDRPREAWPALNKVEVIRAGEELRSRRGNRAAALQTEWILLTSGTTGQPKLVVHTFASLAGAIQNESQNDGVVWSTFYDIRRYGGLQIFLRALLGATSIVLSDAHEGTAEFFERAVRHRVSHISGTPSHWRRALMSPAAHLLQPEYVRLSGEIADQAILNQLRSLYPQARISHAFASTEAGVAFDIKDGLMGLPPAILEDTPGVEMKLVEGSLCIRSARTAVHYLNHDGKQLKDKEGFVDTNDLLELRDGRYYFVGRRDGVINVGGQKVHPEEVEAVINRHPQVRMSLVHTRRNSFTGSLVVADVVLQPEANDQRALTLAILDLCRSSLTPHKVPTLLNFVPSLPVTETGKLARRYA